MNTPEEYQLEIMKAAAGEAGKESVNKLAAVIGGIFPFWGLKKKAVETYVSDLEKSNLPPTTKMIAIANAKKTFKHLKNQITIAQIAQDVASEGTDFSAESKVDDEWLERFMDSAKFVSDEDVQALWGNVLAGEFERPNSTPPSVIRILTEITPRYARVFQILCSLEIGIITLNEKNDRFSYEHHIVLPPNYSYLNEYDITFSTLSELQMLGLIQFDVLQGFILQFDCEKHAKLHLVYGENAATIISYPNKNFPIGTVVLTAAGRSIARFADREMIGGHFEEVVQFLKTKNVVFSEKPEISVEWSQ